MFYAVLPALRACGRAGCGLRAVAGCQALGVFACTHRRPLLGIAASMIPEALPMLDDVSVSGVRAVADGIPNRELVFYLRDGRLRGASEPAAVRAVLRRLWCPDGGHRKRSCWLRRIEHGG